MIFRTGECDCYGYGQYYDYFDCHIVFGSFKLFSSVFPELDCTDAYIYTLLRTAINDNNGCWTCIDYEQLLQNASILKINNKEVLARRITKLVKVMLIERKIVKEEGNKIYYKAGELK